MKRLRLSGLAVATMVAIPTIPSSAQDDSGVEVIRKNPYVKGLFTPSGYNGNYQSSGCYGAPTSNPPPAYAQGCEPPPDWIAYCQTKHRSFNAYNGYYFRYDGLHHPCK